MNTPTGRDRHVDALITFLPVAELTVSRDFYERVLGLDLVVDQQTCLIFRLTDAAFLGICERAALAGPAAVVTTIVTDDVDGWCDRISAAGWSLDSGPEHSAKFGIYHAYLTDPTGNRLEIQRFDDPGWALA
jgi:catechol 2,3-dioxygenase-like lactoylglutathione lyase family enzyme